AEAKQQNVAGGAALPPKLLFEKSCQKIFSFSSAANVIDMQGGCACAKDWRSVKCCCVGQGVRQIPMDMAGPGRAKSVSTIFFFDVSLSRLTPASFAAFHNLEEIFLDNASVLEHVDSRAFSGLKKLRKISISNCPALVSWTGVLLRENPQIQTLTPDF
uniref:LRRNT domain-containing protein n=1 Tax=Globodera pallida TaxID=36090 RepID=A0A183CSR2_GLOPA